jgi:hypothetical protein
MIDSVQIVLFVVISVLTILLVVLGIQVYFILKEIRKTIGHANNVLSHANLITESISKPLSSLASLSTGFKASSVVSVAKIIKSLLAKDEEASGKTAHKE